MPAPTENAGLRKSVADLAATFDRYAKEAGRSCEPGCCSSAMSEARWQTRSQTWGHAAAQVRGLLDKLDNNAAAPQPAPDVQTALADALVRARGYVLARSRVDEQDDNQEQARKNAAKAAATLAAIDAALLLAGRKP